MKRKIVLASHGRLASGMLNSFELICGKQKNISALDCYLIEDFDLSHEVAAIMTENKDSELIVITDLFGGSVNNEFLSYVDQDNFYLVAGLNLPFLIEFMTQALVIPSEELENTLKTLLSKSKETIQYCNNTIHQELPEEDF
ncbi:PTS sugar transporter subunit IIA [Vagococcus salmoninarum]|uniref:PTS sugar transporter subunit IIA n=1 Tax=Vagococcus salmoninarum TaxID=2739 RepID=UPI00188117C1|nr:PTS sugar transporter subunit IIA [Vagococcus salmoninarum]MBE9390162.1 PTS sugar transporter subunit IIA [Vagococcus salmoninarum]